MCVLVLTAPVSAVMPSVAARKARSDADPAPIASPSTTAVNAEVHGGRSS